MHSGDPVTTIDLIRHGECEGGDIFRGSTDVALSPTGWNTMEAAAERLSRGGGWDGIVASPLQRCRRFAEHLAARHALPLEIVADLREMDYGEWEGQDVTKVWREDAERVRQLFTDPAGFISPGGETMVGFQARVAAALRDIIARQRERRLLFVTHGGTIRLLLSTVLDMPLGRCASWHVPYGCVSRLRIYHEGATDRGHLVFHNGPPPE